MFQSVSGYPPIGFHAVAQAYIANSFDDDFDPFLLALSLPLPLRSDSAQSFGGDAEDLHSTRAGAESRMSSLDKIPLLSDVDSETLSPAQTVGPSLLLL